MTPHGSRRALPPVLLASLLALVWHAVLFAAAELVPGLDAPHLTSTLVTLCTLPVPLLAAAALGNWRYSGFAPDRGRPRAVAVTVPLFLVSLVYLVPGGIEGSGETLLRIAVFCLIVGLSEESLWRGVVHRVLARLGRTPAAVWGGVLFGLGHALSGLWFDRPIDDTAFQVASTAAFGFCYAAVRFDLATVWPLVAAHAVYDFAQYGSPGAAPWPVQLAVAAGFVAYGVWRLRRLDRTAVDGRTEPAPQPS